MCLEERSKHTDDHGQSSGLDELASSRSASRSGGGGGVDGPGVGLGGGDDDCVATLAKLQVNTKMPQ